MLDLGGRGRRSDCLVHLSLQRGRAHVRAAARTVDALVGGEGVAAGAVPGAPSPRSRRRSRSASGPTAVATRRTSRSIDVPRVGGDRRQLSRRSRQTLAALVRERRFDDEHGGRLILWHGEPGTGKTHALRALAWEWRKWCTLPLHHRSGGRSSAAGRATCSTSCSTTTDDEAELAAADPRGHRRAARPSTRSSRRGRGSRACSTSSTA